MGFDVDNNAGSGGSYEDYDLIGVEYYVDWEMYYTKDNCLI